MSGKVEIRPVASRAEVHACVDLQVQVWGFDARDAVPFHQLYVAHTWGGQLLVAVDQERVIGFCYGFAGRQYGKPALLSHMLAVLPEYRGQDLGARLKLAQARWALANGYNLITWTYDPLESVNANLNINRLGGIVRQYLVDHYGPMTDGLNKGLPSDRMLVEWHLESPRVTAILAGEQPPPAQEGITCAVPRSFQAVKGTDPAQALQIRLQVREELTAALARGFVVTGFRLDGQTGLYVLTNESEATL